MRLPLLCASLLVASAALAPPGWAQEGTRFLVYFDEFSANLTQKSRGVIADAAKKATETKAKTIRVDVSAGDGQLRVLVVDDGVGLDPARPRSGLGLKGIDERVRELGGTMTISRQHGLGTTLAVQLPLPSAVEEITLARAAG